MGESITYLLNRKECDGMGFRKIKEPPKRSLDGAPTTCLAVASKNHTWATQSDVSLGGKASRLENRETRCTPHERIHIADSGATCPDDVEGGVSGEYRAQIRCRLSRA